MQVHALHPDCRTVLSHWQAVENLQALRKMMRYLGASDEQMVSFEDSLRRWGQGSMQMRLLPNRRNLLHIDYYGFELAPLCRLLRPTKASGHPAYRPNCKPGHKSSEEGD